MKFLTMPWPCLAVSRTLRTKRLVYVWVAAAVVLVVSIGDIAAQPKSNEAVARFEPKKILVLHSYRE